MECEKLFCKTNIKLKVLKLNKTNVIIKLKHNQNQNLFKRTQSNYFPLLLLYCMF